MLFNKTFSLIIIGLFILFTGCAHTQESSLKASSCNIIKDGWVLKTELDGNNPEKFFAIGTWHVPGYSFTKEPESNSQLHETNATLFKEKTGPFNMVFMTPGYQKDYMTDKTHILNPFSPMLHGFLDDIPSLPKGDDKDYYRSQYIKENVNSPEFEAHLDTEIEKLLKNRPNDKYIYSHIDEIALGGVGRWAIPPTVGAKINEKIKEHDNNALVFVDLLGHSRGSTYFFEQRYLQSHKKLPKAPPYEEINQDARDCKIPLLGFFQAYNGSPVYEFKNGDYFYKEYDFETLKANWKENTRLIANAYRNNGDIFGVNAFNDFYANPILAGITVDALKAGLGSEIPIWLYFDGNGYAKPANQTSDSYVKNVMCQIYTSIIHGATGILFWNDWSKTPEVFDELLPELEVLNTNLPIIKLKTVDKIINHNLHIMIKENEKGERFMIASNTSKTDTLSIDVPNTKKKELSPLEVYISIL